MKKIALLAIAASVVLASCAGNPEGKKAETTDSVETTAPAVEGVAYTVDAAASKVEWTGTKVTGAHHGVITITSGSLTTDAGKIIGGSFVLDMNTISSTDLEGEWKEKLDGHLKNEDFFDVAKFPEAKFDITSIAAGTAADDVKVSGNLTIKGVSKNISFDAKVVELTDAVVKVNADFNIAREDWGVSYSGKEDDLISKEINFKVSLTAKK